MSREELLKSDEYITGYVECIIVSGKGIKQTRKEITEKWMAYRDELLAFPTPSKELKSAEDVLDRNGFDFEAFKYENEYSAKNLLAAMKEYAQEYASQLHPSPTPDVTEAVEFAEWVGESYDYDGNGEFIQKNWIASPERYTTQQLYSLFKNQKQ